MNAIDLLTEFRQTRSEAAFEGLAHQFTNLVYSVAQRRLSNSALAEEVTQAVFARLAQAPPKLKADAELTAWLHRTTIHVAIDAWRSETRRRHREQQVAMTEPTPIDHNQLWEELAPMLDEALDELNDSDRQALLLRFYEEKAMREIGQKLGVSEDAAKMRISRAIERLRSRLSLRGVTCASSVLVSLLLEHTMEAAPARLTVKLKPPTTAVSEPIGTLGWAGSLLLVSKAKLVGAALVVLVLGLGLIAWVSSLVAPQPPAPPIAEAAAPGGRAPGGALFARPDAQPKTAGFRAAPAPVPEIERLALHVLNAETGEGIAKAKIHMAYFYAGGRGEAHDTGTDQTGTASLPEALEGNAKGANIFVVAEGYVPKVVNLSEEDARREYTLRLDPGLTIGGVVVDEKKQPLESVKIRVQAPGEYKHGRENVDFQLCPVTTDAQGRWRCSYIPKDVDEARLILTREGFAVTLPDVPMSKASASNLVLVMRRGFTVTGRVVDSQARPIRDAQIKELNNTGYRQQSVTADALGAFVLTGTGEYDSSTTQPVEDNADGTLTSRGLLGSGEAYVRLVIEAEGFAPEIRRLPLRTATNSLELVLQQGKIFRGRILDENGDPISNAVVRTDSDQDGLIKFRWNSTTDLEGRFEWHSAPAEPTLFWFEADGFQVQSGVLLVPDGTEHAIRMRR